jgi:hypothetical protein
MIGGLTGSQVLAHVLARWPGSPSVHAGAATAGGAAAALRLPLALRLPASGCQPQAEGGPGIHSLRLTLSGADEQCALMVLPCWNRVSVYSDPSNHFCTSKLSDPNLSETSRDISKEGAPQNPDSKTLGSESDHPLSPPCRVLSPGVAFAWPRRHTAQCTGSDSDLALFLPARALASPEAALGRALQWLAPGRGPQAGTTTSHGRAVSLL